MAHKQLLSGVAEYYRKFIELVAPLEGIPEEVAKGHFILGLNEEIQAEVRLLGPRSLHMAMELAVKAEDKIRCTQSYKTDPNHSKSLYQPTHSPKIEPNLKAILPTHNPKLVRPCPQPNNTKHQPTLFSQIIANLDPPKAQLERCEDCRTRR